MRLTGVHLLLTYQCTYQCDHCFVWGSPEQPGTMSLPLVRRILEQARGTGTVEWIYFEGGEPFLFYATTLKGARLAADFGFKVGIVSNAYWATDPETALESLRPFAGLVRDLSVSSDLYHGNDSPATTVANAVAAAHQLGIPVDTISIAQPDGTTPCDPVGQIPPGESAVRFRGRAAAKLAGRARKHPWSVFDSCPYEPLRSPKRVHVDPLGHVHACQGISIGNVNRSTLAEIVRQYDPDTHPIIGPLLAGGPAELVRRLGQPHGEEYADACHFCDEARHALRSKYPHVLTPDQMYGVREGS